MGADPYLAKAMLDWALLGATPTQPASLFMQLATAVPTTDAAYEAPQFTNRMRMTFAAAQSPAGSATNLNSYIRTATAAATLTGWNLWDSPSGGNRLFFGTLTAAIACPSGSGCRIGAGNIKILLG